ncbi:hypothetical protein [Mesorhizobium sangaii]|uniref:Ferredoxin-NADP reductase n=1 Tax=Mesorhizobium sangaii TaxID=505389 RepID=A0A841PFC5_9HYPH|nr:hypothetical protein [Mesorhizobium sangaii]MBB6413856.1 ferredoxin-NADP reductase [Mesorhizobium sangaii]
MSVIERELDCNTVWLHFDDEPETREDLESLLSTRSSDAQLYYCGPPGFMAAVDRATAHWPERTVHFGFSAAGTRRCATRTFHDHPS